MKNWTPDADPKVCIARYGNMAQVAGVRRVMFLDGKSAGIEAVDINTGSGLQFTVLPGRGMDIVGCSYRGVPVSYLSKAGITSPAYYDSHNEQWLKSFFGGLMTTCGISNAGPECCDWHPFVGNVQYGLHGDISNTGADQLCVWEDWTTNGYEMQVSGRVSEGRFHGEHLVLRRTIRAFMGEKVFHVHDVYRNDGNTPEPLMFFYHINLGYPLYSEYSHFLSASKNICAKTEISKAGIDRYDRVLPPQPNAIEQQYFHELYANEYGYTIVALVNMHLEFGLYLKYKPKQLPCLAEWKVEREGEYVFAFEPGNCHPVGRQEQRRLDRLEILNPMQTHSVDLEFGIVDGLEEINELRQQINRMQQQAAVQIR